jgi:hypothetical protein
VIDVRTCELTDEELEIYSEDKCNTHGCRNDAVEEWGNGCNMCGGWFCGACLNNDTGSPWGEPCVCDGCLITMKEQGLC